MYILNQGEIQNQFIHHAYDSPSVCPLFAIGNLNVKKIDTEICKLLCILRSTI